MILIIKNEIGQFLLAKRVDEFDRSDHPCLRSEKPNLIIANTSKGKGISFIENVVSWHHRVPTDEEYKLALEELNLEHKKLAQ